MNKESNKYIFIYSIALVVVVAAVLSYAAIKLQPLQDENVRVEKMGAILATINKGNDTEALSADKGGYISAQYKEYITASYAVDRSGDVVPGVDAFGLLDDLAGAYGAGTFPVLEATVDGGREYIIPVTGKGLWGPVWGYIALGADCNTILGASFDHKGETPGLGAEITTTAFGGQFGGKELFNAQGQFVSIDLLKGAGSSAGNAHAVDAISGGTLTSNGVKAMLRDCLRAYVPFFEKQRQQ